MLVPYVIYLHRCPRFETAFNLSGWVVRIPTLVTEGSSERARVDRTDRSDPLALKNRFPHPLCDI
jgi:hypothetical protein